MIGNGDLEGALDASGSVMGTYIHGLFHNREFTTEILKELARRKGVSLPDTSSDLDLDRENARLAVSVSTSINMDLIYRVSGLSLDYHAARV